MLSELHHQIVGADRPTAGAASLAQGVYGARGNLELLVPDAADGLWVFWFNADLDSDPIAAPDVPPGAWSAGLHFAAGARYTQAEIVQGMLGPDHLEVVALADGGELESWYWSPGPGFQRRESLIATGARAASIAQDADGALAVVVEMADGSFRVLLAGTAEYPDRVWTDAGEVGRPARAPWDDSAARAHLVAAGIPARDIAPGTARGSQSSRTAGPGAGAHGALELTWRDADGRLRHLPLPR